MTLQEQIKQDLRVAIKGKNESVKDALRVILGEFARQEQKELTEPDVVRILKKLEKSETELLRQQGRADSSFLTIVRAYLPQAATPAEIQNWIEKNIDFGGFQNKMQAMRPIMTHFGARADGNIVKSVLNTM